MQYAPQERTNNMPAETGSAVGAGLLYKYLAMFGIGALGAVFMAVLDPPKTKKLLFWHCLVAGFGSFIFGPLALKVVDYYLDAIDLTNANFFSVFEIILPVCFLIGALSWGLFSAILSFRNLIKEHGAKTIYDKIK